MNKTTNPNNNAEGVGCDALLDCSRCGEDACLVKIGGQALVRVRRKTKCKNYRVKLGVANSPTCKTEIRESAAHAVNEWNSRQSNAKDHPTAP